MGNVAFADELIEEINLSEDEEDDDDLDEDEVDDDEDEGEDEHGPRPDVEPHE